MPILIYIRLETALLGYQQVLLVIGCTVLAGLAMVTMVVAATSTDMAVL
jgi:hypothetical protein